MAISGEMKEYIDGQIDYYISEARSYRQMAETYRPEVAAADDTAFGIIVGSVYASFVNAVQSQGQVPSLEDVQDVGRILKERAPLVKKAILEGAETDGRAPSKPT